MNIILSENHQNTIGIPNPWEFMNIECNLTLLYFNIQDNLSLLWTHVESSGIEDETHKND